MASDPRPLAPAVCRADIGAMPRHPAEQFTKEERTRVFQELEDRHAGAIAGAHFDEVVTLPPYEFAPSDATVAPMNEPERIDAGVYEVYQWRGYTVQRSDQPGYTDRWFVYRERRPFRAFLRGVDQELVTFGSLKEAVAWLTQNPDALPELGDQLP